MASARGMMMALDAMAVTHIERKAPAARNPNMMRRLELPVMERTRRETRFPRPGANNCSRKGEHSYKEEYDIVSESVFYDGLKISCADEGEHQHCKKASDVERKDFHYPHHEGADEDGESTLAARIEKSITRVAECLRERNEGYD